MSMTNTSENELKQKIPQPAVLSKRIDSIDILRGVAVLGILLLNIPSFSMPHHYHLTFVNQTGNPDYWIHAFTEVFFGGKMRALFSAIFGTGVILFISGKKDTKKRVYQLFYKRMLWLVFFGFVHAHLSLWGGDILYCYGVLGMLVFFFRNMKPVYLSMGVVVVSLISLVIGAVYYQNIRQKRLDFNEAVAVEKAGNALTAEHETAIARWQEQARYFVPNEEKIAINTKHVKGSYDKLANYIRPKIWERQTIYLVFRIWDMFALMLLGMALYKWGFFTMKWSKKQYKNTVLIGYGIGLPIAVFSLIYYNDAFSSPESYIAFLEQHPVNWAGLVYDFQRIAIMFGHVALVILLFQNGYFKRLFDGLKAVGQMAFTNYIMHTVICVLIFFGYGLNQYAEWRYYQLFYLVVGIWLFQLIVSRIWLRYFLFGPLEWLWRSATYGRMQPLRRKSLSKPLN